MKVVILAGGLGTRLNEETHLKPKPMVEIGGMPILWHIMKIYSHYNYNDFIICLGYKGSYIREWFNNYFLHQNDVIFDFENNKTTFFNNKAEKWKVTLVDTGDLTMTGGRLKKVKDLIGDQTFMMTYGDGVADIDIKELLDFHKKNKKIATISAIVPEGRFGSLILSSNDDIVLSFNEKKDNQNRVSGGFFVLEPKVFDYIEGDETTFEQEPLERLVKENNLVAYKHNGFWKPMDTINDKNRLEDLWKSSQAKWKIWK